MNLNCLTTWHSCIKFSMPPSLKKCAGDPTSIVQLDSLCMNDNLSYEEISVEIFDQQFQKLRNKRNCFG